MIKKWKPYKNPVANKNYPIAWGITCFSLFLILLMHLRMESLTPESFKAFGWFITIVFTGNYGYQIVTLIQQRKTKSSKKRRTFPKKQKK